MKLAGNYSFEDLRRTLQGNFSCQLVTKDSRGHWLDEKDQRVTLELYFIRVDMYPNRNEIVISSVSEDESGQKNLKTIMTLQGK